MKATIPIIIRFSDCDPMGHTNNSVYFTFMEQARVGLFKKVFAIGPDDPVRAQDFPFIIAEISCRFLKPTFPDQTIFITAKIRELKNSSFFIDYEMKDSKDELVATGSSAQVWYDYVSGKATPIPPNERSLLTKESS